MKLLLDFLPVILFFGTFKYGEANKDWAAAFATEHFGFMVSGGVVPPDVAPVLLATVVVILATLVQVGVMIARGKKIDTMVWVSLVLVVVLGGATIWFHSETFIKWKLTAVYWIMAVSFFVASAFFRKNLLKALIGAQISLPEFVWRNLNLMWIAFFVFMGALNLYVAFNYSTDTWVNFKLFGGMGLMLVFMVGQGLYLNKHIQPHPQPTQPDGKSGN
jgi:intracellular septation protein